jgi:hypothetical protein
MPMSEAEQRERTPSDQTYNARIGYQVAIEMWAHSGEEVWARFNVMLVANSIIIAVVGVALTSQRALPALTVLLPVVGIILCLLWLILMKRGFDYQIYYILSASELEERYLAGTVKTISRGAAFACGKEVSIQTGNGLTNRRMGFWSRLLTAQSASYFVIILFMIVYIVMLLQTCS